MQREPKNGGQMDELPKDQLPKDGSEHGTGWPAEVVPFLARAMTCHYASLTRDGRPITWPITSYPNPDGQSLDVSTGLTYPSKAERARRNARVALLFSDPVGSGLSETPVVLVLGQAAVRDADLQANLDRYLRESMLKTPKAYAGTPQFLMRTINWYLARIWVHVFPQQILWWPRGRLDIPPERWEAPAGTAVPGSDPGPTGPALPPRTTTPTDWRPFADRAQHLGPPVLTLADPDGWPLPLRCRAVERVEGGYLLDPSAGFDLEAGPACLTFDTHAAGMQTQENVVLVGEATAPDQDGRVLVRVERALTDWSVTGNRLTRTLSFLSNGRKLRPRLAAEASRRGQPVPVVRRLQD
jgi:hypothetical protein